MRVAAFFLFFAFGVLPFDLDRRADTSAAEEPARFDIVSIHETNPANDGFSIDPNPDNFHMVGGDLAFLIQLAYGKNPSEIQNIPAPLDHKHFDIYAKVDVDSAMAGKGAAHSGDPEEVLSRRLKNLLEERFQLKVTETKLQRPVLDLVTSKRGAKLTLSTPGDRSMLQAWGRLKFAAVDMDGFATTLSNLLHTTVRDKTKLTGSYAFELHWDTHDPSESAYYPFHTLNDALNERLGLKLVPAKASVDVLEVTRAEMPTPN